MFRGKLVRNSMPPEARRAYGSWCDQRARCNKPNHACFKWYGAKGIRVEYGSREFINWWLREVRCIGKGRWVCDRINPDKNYKFGNVQLITQSENARRQDRKGKRKAVRDLSTNKVYPSIRQAAKATGKSVGNVCSHCRKYWKVQKFKYEK